MKRNLCLLAVFAVWLGATGAMAYAVHANRHGIELKFSGLQSLQTQGLSSLGKNMTESFSRKMNSVSDIRDDVFLSLRSYKHTVSSSFSEMHDNMSQKVEKAFDSALEKTFSVLEVPENHAATSSQNGYRQNGYMNASYSTLPAPRTLSEIRRRKQEEEIARVNAQIEPAAPPAPPAETWTPEQNELSVEAVLVPRQVTVISSSQDGRIAEVPVSHGDTFKKGDLLIAYDCSDLRAEAEIVNIEKDLTRKKLEGSDKLFKLDIISDIDRLGAQVEDKQVLAKSRLYEARMRDCEIRAQFDGRVTNKLANPGEYTRTDRVLLEVASNEPLQAEFLVPSKWLRWVNIGAPVSITLGETEKTYTAKIQRIHGEVDPVSQSIQMIATLDSYNDPLLPGMSGQAKIDISSIRQAGITGYLETTPASYGR